MRRRFSLLVLFVAAAIVMLAGGCAYSLGRGEAKLDFATISLAPIKNKADLPQVHALLARNISDELNSEGGLKLVKEGAQAELTVVVNDYSRSISISSSRDTVVASSINVKLELICSLRNTRTGEFYFQDKKITATTEAYLGSATGLAETQTLPALTRLAAQKVREAVVGVW
ncbi:MAG: LPS assembly lipoprotein LptE [Opitutae bacterium]|nr:LPS assembly lipoprotein LptE [Opitutae bacterium]